MNEDLKIEKNIPLKNLTTMRVGGSAKYFVNISSADEAIRIFKYIKKENLKFFILGNGSNVIFSDKEYDGLVVNFLSKLNLSETGEILSKKINIEKKTVSISADLNLSNVINSLSALGYRSFENLIGIPSSIGGAVFMNAGAYDVTISDNLINVTFIDYEDLKVKTLPKEKLNFSYRNSFFQNKKTLILSAEFSLIKDDENLIKNDINIISEKRKNSQPLNFSSSGSFFKRPPNNFAGTLIDKAGLKGKRIGGALVSEKHAGFILNDDNASFEDILTLKNLVIDTVYKKFKVKLEPEVRIIE